MNRRGFLKLLGATTAGTLAYEQLSWLVRQPHSVSMAVEESLLATLRIMNIAPGSDVFVFSDEGKVLAKAHEINVPEMDFKVPEGEITVHFRKTNELYSAYEIGLEKEKGGSLAALRVTDRLHT